ncbi:MAG TPA: hypothetical protein VIN10_08135 [Bacteroidales bacterium]
MDKVEQLLKNMPNPPKNRMAYVFNRAENLSDVVTNKSIFCFELADFNIFGKKNEILQKKFSENQFDLLINFADTEDLVNQKLIAEIKSSFKIGTENPEKKAIFDLVIKYENEKDYEGYYKQAMHYLSVLNISTV